MSRPYQHLPYQDTKPHGAADFYFAIDATFRFLLQRLGYAGWVQYLRDLGTEYFSPVNRKWKEGGLAEVAAYWREFFTAEPDGEVEVKETGDQVTIEVRRCPAIAHLRQSGRIPVKEFCQHCYYLGQSRAAEAGMSMRLRGGNGQCQHTYRPASIAVAEQDLKAIEEVK